MFDKDTEHEDKSKGRVKGFQDQLDWNGSDDREWKHINAKLDAQVLGLICF
jgi:hypothetical protein